ncbi:Subtilase family protein [Singulisphaera sp. GP187]|uniref:S8 family serine peptidase n=1 Tax=Singulisphaera sp. GP187 TaxID=1882752 RepID=UPI00092BC440|nr:S8 family serine peptidase [Singulisphaera sp. GP187]SIO58798.1 Subtilase family protein [Singulisphaera sp. GP187]
MADITINGITVDPFDTPHVGLANASPALRGAATALSTAAATLPSEDTNYVLIQAKGPLTAAYRKDLEAAGAKILEYVPESTYVCRYEPADLDPVRKLPFVEWAGPYLQGFKVAASLTPDPIGRMSLMEAAVGTPAVMRKTPKVVDVVFHGDVNVAAAAKEVAIAAGIDPTDVKPSRNKVRLTVQANRLNDLAALDVVRSIEPVFPAKLHNDIARGILGLDSSNPGSLPFEGGGQTVGVADTGFDKGSTASVHPAFTGRVQRLYALGRPGKSNDPNGHGTHVAGSVLGDGVSAVLGTSIRGTAPKARLVFQSVLDAGGGLGGLPTDLRDLFSDPYNSDGVRVHTNSWGSTVGDSRYDSQAFEVDDFVWNNRDCVICFAAGNEGVDADGDGLIDRSSITPPATAKNCITVGASENNRPSFALTYGSGWPSDFPANPIFSDKTADHPEGMVAFSSRGPTSDQRFCPDVVAPGTFVLSARSRDTTKVGWGLSADPQYMFDGGTSMATPLVAGCCALIREYLIGQRNLSTPSAALVKAMLINGALGIPGQYTPTEAGPIPNFADGFGRADMAAVLGPGEVQLALVQDEGRQLDTGDEETVTVQVPAGVAELKATLVWTDPAGATLQNDLDLIVRAGGQEWHGNVASGSLAFDRVNNVEQLIWPSPPAGQVEVVVRAFRITRFSQPFALVVRLR